MRNIIDRISAEYRNLTKSQQKVAEYFLNNLNQAALLNSTKIAKCSQVSEATVTRFVTSLGFSGFPEFKQKVNEIVYEKFLTPGRLAKSVEAFGREISIVSEIAKGDIENIQRLTTEIPHQEFEKAVKTLRSARSMYVLGLRSSYALAFYLAFNLRFILDNVRVRLIRLGVGDLTEQIHEIDRNDVLVAISFKRYTRETIRITEIIKKKGASIIAITDNSISPLAQLSDISFTVQTQIPTYIESYTAAMCLINALITSIALKDKEKALSALNRLEKDFEELETYIG